jgi:hypothetical protein
MRLAEGKMPTENSAALPSGETPPLPDPTTSTRTTISPSTFPFGLDTVARAYASSVSTNMSAYEELPGHHLRSTLDLVASTTAQKIVALHPSLWALGSSVRLSARRYSRLGFALPRLSPSTTARPNLNFGSPISAWRVSWAGPPTIGSSSDNSPYSSPTPLEPGSRISCLDRSTTGMIS